MGLTECQCNSTNSIKQGTTFLDVLLHSLNATTSSVFASRQNMLNLLKAVGLPNDEVWVSDFSVSISHFWCNFKHSETNVMLMGFCGTSDCLFQAPSLAALFYLQWMLQTPMHNQNTRLQLLAEGRLVFLCLKGDHVAAYNSWMFYCFKEENENSVIVLVCSMNWLGSRPNAGLHCIVAIMHSTKYEQEQGAWLLTLALKFKMVVADLPQASSLLLCSAGRNCLHQR